MVHPERFEPPTPAFGGQCSIQLSYGCVDVAITAVAAKRQHFVATLLAIDRGEAAKATTGTLQARVALNDDRDDIDRTKLALRRGIAEGTIVAELGTLKRQRVAIGLAPADMEIDCPVVDDSGAADIAQ